jgi:plasmid maintenance system killer protein
MRPHHFLYQVSPWTSGWTSYCNPLKTHYSIKVNVFKHLQVDVKPPANLLILHYSKELNNIKDLHTIVEVYYKCLNTIEKTHYSIKVNEVNTVYTIVELELHSTTSCEH